MCAVFSSPLILTRPADFADSLARLAVRSNFSRHVQLVACRLAVHRNALGGAGSHDCDTDTAVRIRCYWTAPV